MNNPTTLEDSKPEQIEWKQLWSLAALYGSIVIGWIAYHNYQPKLLTQFNFTEFSFALILAQSIILVITPPIAGRIGDRFRFKSGHRIPIISSGISFAAMIFMAVAFTLLGNPGEIFKWVLPVLIVLWLISMSIFTSPALSTLELFTPIDKLPRAMAVLTIVANLIYSLEPVIVDLIDYLGAPITFICGGVVVFVSGYALKKNSLSLFSSQSQRPRAEIRFDTQRSNYLYIFFMGAALGLTTTLLFNYFPDLLQANLGHIISWEGKWLLVGILVVTAVLSLPASDFINRIGVYKSFWWSFLINSLTLIGLFGISSGWVTLLLLLIYTISFTLLSISSLPLAIEKANYYEKVFCVGIFFSGVALPDGMVEIIQAMNG
ncbi:MAG: Major Facilitator Superfamily protein [Bacteroidetes bacterium OLB12]|nr:MAG: Major Facilitator Superfamily protein [Bacteroidetes bacterium OLB12]